MIIRISILLSVVGVITANPSKAIGPQYPCSDYTDTNFYGPDGLPTGRPLIIAHRGSSGMYPEHTALGYREAAKQGADLIECDLEITKDLHFICAHEPYLSKTTDIATKFGTDRKATYNMDDDDPNFDWNDKGEVTDYFSFDFTLAELQTLKKYQANDFRDPRYDYLETVVTLEELDKIVKEEGKKQGRTIGIYPEIKHPAATNKILKARGPHNGYPGLANFTSLENETVNALHALGYNSPDSPCYLQSFELTSLETMRSMTDLKLVFLLEQNITQPTWDRIDKLKLAGIGVDKGNLVTPGVAAPSRGGKGGSYRAGTTDFIQQVHDHGLKAHCFTFRNEWMKLYWDHGQDPYSQLREYLDLKTDGYFSDFPLTTRRFLNYEGILCSNSPTFHSSSSLITVIFLYLARNIF